MTFDLHKYFDETNREVEDNLKHFMPAETTFPQKLHESMRYSLFAGGKRIRPILVIAAAQACGGTASQVMPIACALEMIHTFSLIHDDLPAMDDDDLRRGKPTNHKVFGEAMAILAGDALLSEAFVVLSRLELRDKNRVIEIMRDIALGTGSVGMVGGQVVDMLAEGRKISIDELKTLHRLKTGRLIAVSVTSGAKCVSDDLFTIKKLEAYGEAIGLAFQIADDILDVVGGAEIGKDIGSDAANNKSTYVTLLGLDQARLEAKKAYDAAMKALEGFGEEATALREIAKFIIERDR